MRRNPRVLLLDLDGTLVDSRTDLATAVNRMRAERGLVPLSIERIAGHIGWGARNLVARCVLPEGSRVASPDPDPEAPPHEIVEAALEDFRKHYDACLLDTTRPYPHIPEILNRAARGGLELAVVSNKPERFCRKILAGLGLVDLFARVAGGDSFEEKKPSPLPILAILREMARTPEETVMVGDGPADLQAARAAGCPIYMAAWGLTSIEEVKALDPDLVLESPQDLARALELPAGDGG